MSWYLCDEMLLVIFLSLYYLPLHLSPFCWQSESERAERERSLTGGANDHNKQTNKNNEEPNSVSLSQTLADTRRASKKNPQRGPERARDAKNILRCFSVLFSLHVNKARENTKNTHKYKLLLSKHPDTQTLRRSSRERKRKSGGVTRAERRGTGERGTVDILGRDRRG